MSGLTVLDLDKLTADYPDLRMELVNGEIIVRSLSGLESSEVAVEIIGRLSNWVRPRKLGRVIGSSAGFRFHGDVRVLDASFTLAERLPRPTEDYGELVPDLIFEVKSKRDSLKKLRQKIEDFLTGGSQVGVLVDPRSRTMEVYRPNKEKIVLADGDILEVPELLPGWELPVVEVWAPEFE